MDRLERQVRRELSRFGAVEGSIVEVVRAWPAAVGETVARNAWPARLARDGTLHVHAASSTWAFELGRLAPTIVAQLRLELGDATPAALKFVPGPIPESDTQGSGEAPPAAPEVAPEHRRDAADIAAGIEDEELRELVARAAAASLSRAAAEPADDRRF
jgi:hypothetical protein